MKRWAKGKNIATVRQVTNIFYKQNFDAGQKEYSPF